MADKTDSNDTQTEQDKQEKKQGDNTRFDAFSTVLGEFAFIIVPLIVIAMILGNTGKSATDIIASPEWSFASSIMAGQLIIKVIATAVRIKSNAWRIVTALAATLIVLFLIPSLIVLSLVLTAKSVSHSLIEQQMCLFGFNALMFLSLGAQFEHIIAKREAKQGE